VIIPTFTGNIMTTGLLAEGFIVQSIGGGGGVASFVASSGINLAANGISISAGGTGGPGGNGGDVLITSTASIMTTNTGAPGIVVQSIGGGGGVAQVFGLSGSGAVSLGASGGAGGNGGNVVLSSGGQILTTDNGAHAILAQSIGGGGGFVEALGANGAPVNLAVNGGGASGSGGIVSVTNLGTIWTTGAGAYGIIAQSIGGGGGVVGSGAFAISLPATGPFAGTLGGAGTGGPVDVLTSASIVTTGLNSTAIFAESLGGTGANTITVDVASGMIVGGGGSGNAVALVGGLNNLITNSGMLTTVSGVDGMTVTGGLAANSVINNNLVIGSVDLCLNGGCGGANSFDNRQGAIFDSGNTVYLGDYHNSGNLLSNEGLIAPGGYLNVLATNVTGNFTQSTSGIRLWQCAGQRHHRTFWRLWGLLLWRGHGATRFAAVEIWRSHFRLRSRGRNRPPQPGIWFAIQRHVLGDQSRGTGRRQGRQHLQPDPARTVFGGQFQRWCRRPSRHIDHRSTGVEFCGSDAVGRAPLMPPTRVPRSQ
jgi:hypothetical protein